jgi:hypothetical protein
MPDGAVALLNKLDVESWHCGTAATPADDNLDTIGIAFAGDFTKETPTAAALDALAKIVTVINSYLGRQCSLIGHQDIVTPHETLCPGENLESLLAGLPGSVIAPPAESLPSSETATDAATLKQKVRWWVESCLREHEAGNDKRCFAILYDMIRTDGKGLLYRSENAQ